MGFESLPPNQPRARRPVRPHRPCRPRPFTLNLAQHLKPAPVSAPAPQVRSEDPNLIDPLVSALKSLGRFLTSPQMFDHYAKFAAECIQQWEREQRLRKLRSRSKR
jgi:hypothetical protein